MKLSFILLFSLITVAGFSQSTNVNRSATTANPAFIKQSHFYVQTNGQISRVDNVDPSTLQVKEWRVRLYKQGEPATGDKHWGAISGASAEEVMKKLKDSQEFELRSNSFFGKGRVQDEVCTHFNPLGPIAVLDNSSIKDQAQKKVEKLYQQASDVYETFLSVKKDLDVIIRGIENPYADIGSNFKDYADLIKDNILLIKSVQNMSAEFTDRSLDEFENNIGFIESKFNDVNIKRNVLVSTIQEIKEPSSDLDLAGNEQKIEILTIKLVELSQEYALAIANENETTAGHLNTQMIAVVKSLIKLYSLDPDMKDSMELLKIQLEALEDLNNN